MEPDRIKYLFEKYMSSECSEAEQAELALEALKPGADELIHQLMENNWQNWKGAKEMDAVRAEIMLQSILPSPLPNHKVHLLKATWLRYAAMVLLIAGAAVFLYLNNRPHQEIAVQSPAIQPDIVAGGNKAILTLANGSKINLDSAADGSLANQGDMQVIKLANGQLSYIVTKPDIQRNSDAEMAVEVYKTNTITTPTGGQYQVVLADGSKIWLNAASSVTFPTTFSNDRTVEITGEAYLEVATNKVKPFFVKAGSTTIQVIGTSFNVNAYTDEPAIKTTLLEGSVRIDNKILKPGEAFANGKVFKTDIEQDVAWKNGLFNFNGLRFEESMRQLERWYGIRVVYENNNVPHKRLAGKMTRGVSLNGLLKQLSEMGVRYKLENKVLMIIQ